MSDKTGGKTNVNADGADASKVDDVKEADVEPSVRDTDMADLNPEEIVDEPEDQDDVGYGVKVPTEKKDGKAWKGKRVGMQRRKKPGE